MKKRLCLSFVVVMIGVLSLPVAVRTAHASTPSHLPLVAARARSSSSVPLWVSSRAAFKPDGELRAELFAPAHVSMLNENRLRNTDSNCRTYLGSPPLEDFTSKDSLDSLISNALTIIEGRVESTDTGFLDGTPGTLISLSVNGTYKSLGQVATNGPVHVFVGEATIPTPTGLICSKTFSKIPTPRIGDDVVVFASVDPLDAEQRILVIDERTQLVVHHDDRIYARDGAFTQGCLQDFKELGSRIRENQHLHDMPIRIKE